MITYSAFVCDQVSCVFDVKPLLYVCTCILRHIGHTLYIVYGEPRYHDLLL